MADKQKYNFLTALLKQVQGAMRDGDELYQEWCDTVGRTDGPTADGAADDRLDGQAQWLAALEARLEDLEQGFELLACEEADGDDDGDDDQDMRGHEPGVGGNLRDAGRVPANLARAGQRPVERRPVSRDRVYKTCKARNGTE